ncbi:MAG: hypothetical protein GDA39_09810 [Hyphomonadaceae bacterium]|nr:hypothetical protein [Hyphomonadaceae bacterium]MBC6413130.1 hypothetical protein [Hyphomonadaceae bacterium]
MNRFAKFSFLTVTAMNLWSCAVAKTTGKVTTLPFKAAYKTGEITAEGTYHTGLNVYKTTRFAGRTVYQVGSVPVTVTDRALSTTSRVLNVTTQAVDVTGKTIVYTRQVRAAKLKTRIAKYKNAKNILSVFIDVAG